MKEDVEAMALLRSLMDRRLLISRISLIIPIRTASYSAIPPIA